MNRLSKDKAKMIAAEYVLTGYDKYKTLIKCGYSDSYAKCQRAKDIFENVLVRTEISKMQAQVELRTGIDLKYIQQEHLVAMDRLIGKDETNYLHHLVALGRTIGAYKSVDITAEIPAPRPPDKPIEEIIADSNRRRLQCRMSINPSVETVGQTQGDVE